MFYALSKEGKCDWRLWTPTTNTDEVLTSFPNNCPREFFFDSNNQKFYAILEQNLVTVDLKDLKKSEKWSLPFADKNCDRIWKDKTSDKIRCAYLDTDPQRVRVAPKPQEPEVYTVFYEGKSVGEASPIGTVAAAVSFELQSNGKWKFIEARATNSDACDTMGVSVLKIEPSPASSSPEKSSELVQCSGSHSPECVKAVSLDIRKAIKGRFKKEEVYVLNLAQGWALVGKPFDEAGDFYPGSPVFLFSPLGKKFATLNKIENNIQYSSPHELTVSQNREWFSVQAGGLNTTVVYHFDNSEPVKTIVGDVSNKMWLAKIR